MESLALQIITGAALLFLLISLAIQAKRPSAPVPVSGLQTDALPLQDLLGAGFLILYLCLLVFAPKSGATTAASENSGEISPLHMIAAQIVIMIPATFIFFLRYSSPIWKPLLGGTGRASLFSLLLYPILTILSLFLFMLAYHYTGLQELLSRLLEASDTQASVLSLRSGPLQTKIFIAVNATIIAPLTEETMFRGYLYPVLKKFGGFVPALIFTSILFGLAHNHIVSFLPLALFSVLLIFLYERTKTLWAPIIAHALFNTINVTASVFHESFFS